MSSKFSVKGSGRQGAGLKAIMSNLNDIKFDQENIWGGIAGNESLQPEQRADKFNSVRMSGAAAAVESVKDAKFGQRAQALGDFMKASGMESFSQQMDAGSLARQKAATIDLNTRSNRQWEGPEALYPTVIIPYAQETMLLPVDVAGVGAYNMSGNVNESFEDLRPIAAVLADSKFNPGDDLKLVPVYPADAANPNNEAFVDPSWWTPWDHSYGDNDLLGREAHKTNYLAIRKANNLMSLCQAPGAERFEQNDEIESNSIALDSILFSFKTKDQTTTGYFALDTSTMSGRSMRPSNGLTSDEKRQIQFPVNGIDVANFKDKLGASTGAFKSLTDAGLKVYLQFEFSATYHRSTRAWAPAVGPVSIAYVMKDGVKMVPGTPSMPADIAALVKAQVVEAEIVGILASLNHNNVNRSRYGTVVVYASSVKPYGVNKRNPISVKYPMQDDDNNADVLAMLVKQMDVMVTRNMSHDAFKAAGQHFARLYDNNGSKIVNINDDSASIMPGQHFLTTTAVDSKINLVKEVSTLDSKDTRDNIEAALVNKIYDIITALRVNSNIAALKELDGRKEEYVIVAHASLAPFLMTTGDYRTFGENVKFKVVETNIDSEIGRMWVVPASQTTDTEIDIFGGMGVCVAKELLVIEGQVAQADRQYRMVISQPSYAHHSLCPVAGRLVVEDMDLLLGDEGLITSVNKHLIAGNFTADVSGGQPGTDDKVEVELAPNPAP
ncbi:hypothetical protein CF8_0116 [Aeromonas phage CF8]|nr:hypothetical protein CF8_0116 [Aeromonas phage CF8]